MKLKKLCYAAAVALATCLIHNASAQTGYSYFDTGDHLFGDPNNWSPTGVPGPNDWCFIGINFGNSDNCTIPVGDVETVGTADGQNIFGPQWGATLNIYGSLSFGFIMVPCQWDSTANRSTINMYSGSSLTSTWGGNTLLLGDTWFSGQPYVTMNMYGNSLCSVAYMSFGGHLNIYDNATNILTAGPLMGPATGGFWGQGGPSDATRQINIAGGTFIMPTGNENNLTNWIERGILVVYGKQYDTNEIIITDDGTNTYTTVPPLGTLSNIALTSPRSTMMVGTFQNPVALLNFTGVQGVPFTGVDAAQTGPGTLAYHSSDPTVIGVTAGGHVTAIKPGTATVSATFGAFTSTNSVTITVTPFTNSLIHRYSFSETSGSTTKDSVPPADGTWDGTVYGTLGGGVVTLDGSSGYVQFPAGIVSNMNAVTIEAWANFGGSANAVAWAPLFYFGNQDGATPALGENYIGFQPFTGAVPPTANALFGTGDPGYANEQDATLPLVSGGVTNFLGNVHIAIVYHPYAGYVALYTNGVLAAINNNVSNPLAAALGNDPINYLGASLYASDPLLNATIDEFRIYNGPLSVGQIMADYALGPNQLIGTSKNVSLAASLAGGNLKVTWPTNSALVNLMSSPTLGSGASWSAVIDPLVVAGTNYQMTIPATGGIQFFRLQQ